MSRTIKGSKPAGYEFWSKRPFKFSSGRFAKKMTASIERQQAKVRVQDLQDED